MVYRSSISDVGIPDAPLTDVVFRAARQWPDRPALADAATGRVLTFGQLLHEVRCLAAGLAAHGLTKGDVVALWSPNSPDFAVAFHAIARLGAIVTPSNPANTSHELAVQLTNAAGAHADLTLDLRIDNATNAVSGSLHGTAAQ